MTDNSGLPRTAESVFAEGEARDRVRRRRILRIGSSFAAIALLYIVACHPRYQSVAVSPPRTIDVISVAKDYGIAKMFGQDGASLGPVLVIDYYSGQEDPDARGDERLDIFQWARPKADKLGFNAIVLWRTEPTMTRWLPFVHGDAAMFRKHADGSWGGL